MIRSLEDFISVKIFNLYFVDNLLSKSKNTRKRVVLLNFSRSGYFKNSKHIATKIGHSALRNLVWTIKVISKTP